MPVPLVAADSKLLRVYRLESEPTTIPDAAGLQVLFVAPHRYIMVSADR